MALGRKHGLLLEWLPIYGLPPIPASGFYPYNPRETEFLDFLLGLFCVFRAYDSIYVGNDERGFV